MIRQERWCWWKERASSRHLSLLSLSGANESSLALIGRVLTGRRSTMIGIRVATTATAGAIDPMEVGGIAARFDPVIMVGAIGRPAVDLPRVSAQASPAVPGSESLFARRISAWGIRDDRARVPVSSGRAHVLCVGEGGQALGVEKSQVVAIRAWKGGGAGAARVSSIT